jgi:hypothetical protein
MSLLSAALEFGGEENALGEASKRTQLSGRRHWPSLFLNLSPPPLPHFGTEARARELLNTCSPLPREDLTIPRKVPRGAGVFRTISRPNLLSNTAHKKAIPSTLLRQIFRPTANSYPAYSAPSTCRNQNPSVACPR